MRFKSQYEWIDGTPIWTPVLASLWTLIICFLGWRNYQAGGIIAPMVAIILFFVFNYISVAWFLNRTILLVTPTQLEIRHEPVPWFGEKTVNVADIEFFSFQRYRGVNIGKSARYWFYCNLVGKKRLNLFYGAFIVKPEQATKAVTRVRDWLEPYHNVEFIEDKREWPDT